MQFTHHFFEMDSQLLHIVVGTKYDGEQSTSTEISSHE